MKQGPFYYEHKIESSGSTPVPHISCLEYKDEKDSYYSGIHKPRGQLNVSEEEGWDKMTTSSKVYIRGINSPKSVHVVYGWAL